MDIRLKKRAYRVSRNVFFLLGILFSLLTVEIFFAASWFQYPAYALIGVIFIYAVAQHITGERLRASIEAEKNRK